MPVIVLVLFLLPVRLSGTQLKGLAFALWLLGGLVMVWRGGLFLMQALTQTAGASPALLALVVLVALIIGAAKGKFVLSKTSRRNIERLDALTEPQRPIHVYSIRSWMMILLMVMISVSLTLFHAPELLRGAVNLGIGAALIISSLAYAKSLTAPASATSLQNQK
jgi:hypothetical protein